MGRRGVGARASAGVAAAGLALALALAAGAGEPARQGADPQDAADRAALQQVCGRCHNLEIVLDTAKSAEEWEDTVQIMVDRGARGSDAQFDAVMRYLRAHVTAIDVNAADAADLESVLGVPPGVADAVVARRKAHPFTSLTDLQTVPGVDARSLQSKRKLIRF